MMKPRNVNVDLTAFKYEENDVVLKNIVWMFGHIGLRVSTLSLYATILRFLHKHVKDRGKLTSGKVLVDVHPDT